MTIVLRSLVAFLVLQVVLLLAPSILSSPGKGPNPESCLACADRTEAMACHQVAMELAEARDFERAIPIEERVFVLASQEAQVAAALARMHQLGTKNSVRAIKLYHEALALVPGYPPALLGLGQIMKDKGEMPIAERYFARGMRENPDQPLFRVRLAEVLLQSGRNAEAQPLLEEIVSRWPESGEAESARKLMPRTSLAKP